MIKWNITLRLMLLIVIKGEIMITVSKKLNIYLRLCIIAIGLLIGHKAGLGDIQAMTISKAEEASTTEGENSKDYELKRISSYGELVKLLKDRAVIVTREADYIGLVEEAIDTQKATNTFNPSEALDYSTTNLQVQGVDEADVMKNDGRYIYKITGTKSIAIIDTKDQLKVVSKINSGNLNFDTMFLDKDRLIVFAPSPIYNAYDEYSKGNGRYIRNRESSTLQIYDIKDKTNPKLLREIEVEGSMHSVRKINNTIYMITNKWIRRLYENEFSKEDVLPFYKDSFISQDRKPIEVGNIWYKPWGNISNITLMTAVDIEEKKPIHVQALLGGTSEVYMDQDSLYLAESVYTYLLGNRTTTYLNKYKLDKQNITYLASGSVSGRLLNQFSMDEYKGNLRIAVTRDNRDSHAVYVLDENLNKIGSLEGLAPGEKLYSVRFDGEKGYVVTFKQVDPLFVIDLKDPKSPKVLGELKIPGYSQYLHPIGTDLVVGIGRSTSETIRRDEHGNEVIVGVVNEGIKLSLFNVKDMSNPKEINNIILGTAGSQSEALSNHKAVTVHKKKQLLAIPVSIVYDKKSGLDNFIGAYVFGVENGKLVGKTKLGKIGDSSGYQKNDRVCYIGDKLYFIYKTKDGFKINEYELETFKRTRTITLN